MNREPDVILDELIEFYGNHHDAASDEIEHLYKNYTDRYESNIMDAAAVATALEIGDIRDQVDPRVLEAFHLQYPNVDMQDLDNYAPEQLQGFVNGVKGKLFEILIRDNLNNGEWVGDIHLSNGELALLADSPVQAGWDLEIVDSHGNVVEYLQAKATDSLAYIHEALQKYPDIKVITDLPSVDHVVDGVIDAHIQDGALETLAEDSLEEMSQSLFRDFLEHMNPLIPAAVITVTEGYGVLVGRSKLETAARRGFIRLSKSMGAMSVAALLNVWNAPGLLCIGGSVVTRMGIESFLNRCKMADVIEKYDLILTDVIREKPSIESCVSA